MSTPSVATSPPRRLATLLFWFPLLCAGPVFLVVRELIPDLHRGSLGDGFRKLHVFLEVLFPVTALCWLAALALRAYLDVPRIPRTRLWIWLAIGGTLWLAIGLILVAGTLAEFLRR